MLTQFFKKDPPVEETRIDYYWPMEYVRKREMWHPFSISAAVASSYTAFAKIFSVAQKHISLLNHPKITAFEHKNVLAFNSVPRFVAIVYEFLEFDYYGRPRIYLETLKKKWFPLAMQVMAFSSLFFSNGWISSMTFDAISLLYAYNRSQRKFCAREDMHSKDIQKKDDAIVDKNIRTDLTSFDSISWCVRTKFTYPFSLDLIERRFDKAYFSAQRFVALSSVPRKNVQKMCDKIIKSYQILKQGMTDYLLDHGYDRNQPGIDFEKVRISYQELHSYLLEKGVVVR